MPPEWSPRAPVTLPPDAKPTGSVYYYVEYLETPVKDDLSDIHVHLGALPGGSKHDQGKLRYDLIPHEAERGYAHVLTLGAKKYADRNWERGIAYSRCVAALRRHLAEFLEGRDQDPDGQHVLDSIMFYAGALRTFEARGMGQAWDDLPGRRHLHLDAPPADPCPF